jgi:hypothetical protein
MRIFNVTGLLLAFVAAACAAPGEPAGTVESDEIGADEAAAKFSDVDAVPAYFNHDNRYALSDDPRWIYARFNAHVGKHVQVDVQTAPGAEGASVGFKLYRILENGTLKLVETVDGPDGHAVYTFKSEGPGSYVVELATSGHLADLVLRLACAGGNCSPDPQPGDFCGSLLDGGCAEGLYCRYEPEAICGAADAGGTCSVKPEICTKEYAPVCGCDDQTYGNACSAAANGVSVAHKGGCSPGGGANEGELCGGYAGFACAEGLYCAYPREASCGAGDQAGVCARRPDACIQIYDPVCGCDGLTHGNACSAASSGVSVAHEGECAPPLANVGESCGGFRMGVSPVCAEGLYCNYAPGDLCGWADAQGTCATKPEACTKNYAPVCGCDGQTYGNACSAGMNGVAVLHDGAC